MRSWRDEEPPARPRPLAMTAVTCLKCSRRFMSPDRRRVRLCARCDQANQKLGRLSAEAATVSGRGGREAVSHGER